MTLGGYLMISDAPNCGVTFMIVLFDTRYSCDTIIVQASFMPIVIC